MNFCTEPAATRPSRATRRLLAYRVVKYQGSGVPADLAV